MYYDGHVHTPFCPHGSADTFEMYIERAITLGLKGITFTEHAPLPKTFHDPAPAKDSAMAYQDLNAYFQKLHELKKEYKNQIEIKTGLEVDFIEGFEEDTHKLLREVWPEIDDAILSVHFLKLNETFYCMDFDEVVFGEMVKKSGSLSAVYQNYFNAVTLSVKHVFTNNQPLRIGHITLAKKFQQLFPVDFNYSAEMKIILDEISNRGMSLDYNGAGLAKPYCLEPYPPLWVIKEAQKRRIPLIYGSDAHTVKGLGQGFDAINASANLATPLFLNRSE
ncbi:histidinol-phosphatase HisJ [Bacillus sp. NEB1478]|uniref:histidinol-phosphatase HisJ n=1 Tax=Bacillus sp. NEB1478 TaxID=3073816 RepID=UPI002872C430|nr:histidinol-phosphatase HisJ [Bacillus sp. NEB1478]WNB93134.1 histidinol-phosphatase HisJ [Bacillus sp. NEB1478]